MGPGRCLGGYRYSTHPALPHPHHPGYTPSPAVTAVHVPGMLSRGQYMVVGLISVEQLTLDPVFSDIRGITEGYNLVKIGNR